MSKTRLWVIGSVAAMIVVALAAWFLGISPQLASAAQADADRAGVDSKNSALTTNLVQLKKDFADLSANQAVLDKLREQVPGDGSLDLYLGELDKMATASGVSVTGFTSSAAAPFQAAAGSDVVVPSGVTSANFVTIPITVTVAGTRDQIMAFVGEMQSDNYRLTLVNHVSVTVGKDAAAGTSGNITGIVYELLDTPIVTATATPAPVATNTP